MKHKQDIGLFLLISILLILSAFSLIRYAPLLKAKQELEKQNQEAKIQLVKLRSDLNNLAAELEAQKMINQEIHNENQGLQSNIAQFQQDLATTNEQLQLLTSSLLSMNRENAELKEDKHLLAQQLESVLQDHRNLLAKTSSLKELKDMISQVKQQIMDNKAFLLKKLDEKRLAEGNKGFVVKDGKETHQPKVLIEVIPAS